MDNPAKRGWKPLGGRGLAWLKGRFRIQWYSGDWTLHAYQSAEEADRWYRYHDGRPFLTYWGHHDDLAAVEKFIAGKWGLE